MKRIILIILLIAMGLIGYQYFHSEVIAYDVTEVMHKNTEAGAEVLVTGPSIRKGAHLFLPHTISNHQG